MNDHIERTKRMIEVMQAFGYSLHNPASGG